MYKANGFLIIFRDVETSVHFNRCRVKNVSCTQFISIDFFSRYALVLSIYSEIAP